MFHASSYSSEYSCTSFHPLDTVSLNICTVPSEETSSAKTLVLIHEWPSILDPQYLWHTEGTKNMPYSWQLLLHVWWVHATTSMTCKSNPIPRASDQSCQPHCNFFRYVSRASFISIPHFLICCPLPLLRSCTYKSTNDSALSVERLVPPVDWKWQRA